MSRSAQSNSSSPHVEKIPADLTSTAPQFVGTPFTTPSTATPFEYPFPKPNTPNFAAPASGAASNSAPGLAASSSIPPSSSFLSSSVSASTLTLLTTRNGKIRPASCSPNPDSRRNGSSPIPIPSSASAIERGLQSNLGLRSSSVPIPPSLLEKARRHGTALEGLNFP